MGWFSTGHKTDFEHLPEGYVFDDGYGELYRKCKGGKAQCVSKGSPNRGLVDQFRPDYQVGLCRNSDWKNRLGFFKKGGR